MTTPMAVFRALLKEPGTPLIRRWNWKAALVSSLFRALLFFFADLRAGIGAASGAMLAEFTYRALTAGFYGSVTQSFRRVEPAWQGALSALALLMATSHSLEFAIHSLRGTPNLRVSIAASISVTITATLFDLHAMRMGVLTTDGGSASFADDLRRLPEVLLSFLSLGRWSQRSKTYNAQAPQPPTPDPSPSHPKT